MIISDGLWNIHECIIWICCNYLEDCIVWTQVICVWTSDDPLGLVGGKSILILWVVIPYSCLRWMYGVQINSSRLPSATTQKTTIKSSPLWKFQNSEKVSTKPWKGHKRSLDVFISKNQIHSLVTTHFSYIVHYIV